MMHLPVATGTTAAGRKICRRAQHLPVSFLLSGLLTLGVRAGMADEASASAQPAAPKPPVASQVAPRRDALALDPTSIRGNQELPKVLYIVPWKDPGLIEPAGRPLNSLLDEALSPVDREVFRRQMLYFDQLYGGAETHPDTEP